MKNLLTLLATALTLSLFAGCNTVDGIGEDIEQAGEKMQDAAH